MLRIGLTPTDGEWKKLRGLPEWMARLLYARGIRTDEEARHFLHPELGQIRPPMALPGMEEAVNLLMEAKEAGKRIAVYGDYDVDGVCASAILKEAFDRLDMDAIIYIPDRHQEGYGLNTPAVKRLANECQVLVTVDCGIASVEEVAAAKQAGMQVIVTDHHRPSDQLPPADAIVSPLLSDYPFPYLCGAGVAWKLAWGLIGDSALPLMELAALATVADLVPLIGENRAIVSLGLEKLAGTHRPGLRAIMEMAGIKENVTSEQVAFQIAPRMNACGRLESARMALDMLLTRDPREAHILAARMEVLNQSRKSQESKVIEEALLQVEKMNLLENRALVVMGENWNSGVVGLAAGKIAEKYTCPTVALSRDGDVCVGSARSAGDVDIHLALSQCADLFIRFGGHKQAAGLTIETAHVAEFARRFSQAVAHQTGDQALIPSLMCDGEMDLEDVTEETVSLLSQLQPFGMGNPAPRFLCEGVQALSLRAVGSQGKHLKCTFQQGNAVRDGIFFGGGDWEGQLGSFRMVMTPVINAFRGKVTAECQLYALQLQPEMLPYDPLREALSAADEMIGSPQANQIAESDLPSFMEGNQGTLLVCRCLETALRMKKMFPQADFALESAVDPKAYHTIVLYSRARNTCASFRHVVLCDGSLGEDTAYHAACPGADIHALPQSPSCKRLLAAMHMDLDTLRDCYRQLKTLLPRDLEQFAKACHIREEQAAFALKLFCLMGLADGTIRPFQITLRRMVKCHPEDHALFRMVRRAKEEQDGVYSL